MLSNWELNRKPTPPKYLTRIIEFLGYVPDIKLDFDRYGTYTQLFRIEKKINLKKFSKEIGISEKEIKHLEYGKYGKRHRVLEIIINKFLEQHSISCVMLS